MPEPTVPNYPDSYEDSSSLLGTLQERIVATIKTSISVDSVQLTLEEDLTGLDLPCFLVFQGGEIWYVQSGELFVDANPDTIITLSTIDNRAVHGSPLQPHNSGEKVFFTYVETHQKLFKSAIEVMQQNGFLIGTEAEKDTYESSAVAGEGFLATDTQKIYYCFTAGAFTWINRSSHADLTGLADDDHTQYHTDTRASTWHGGVAGTHIQDGNDHDHITSAEGLPVVRIRGGLEASRPGSPSFPGDMYFSTDTAEEGTLFLSSDGTSWTKISGAPTGAIMAFDIACPAGWSRFTALDDKFARGGATRGATGGANSHNHTYTEFVQHYHVVSAVSATNVTDPGTHTHYITIESGSGGSTQPVDATDGNKETSSSNGNHGHTATIPSTSTTTDGGGTSPSTSTDNHLPPYKEVVWCKKD